MSIILFDISNNISCFRVGFRKYFLMFQCLIRNFFIKEITFKKNSQNEIIIRTIFLVNFKIDHIN